MSTQFLSTLFRRAKPGALFVYDDNGDNESNTYFDAQGKAQGLQCLIAQDTGSWTPRYWEQTSGLGGYLQKFGQQPKLWGYVSYRVLRKEYA